ncbi:MAG TPA: hypothetical protein VI322_02690 [Candidatus Saccharimonadia bacterium]
MAKNAKRSAGRETDDAYFLKLLIYLVLGFIWIKHDGYVIFPLGLVIGVIIAQKDHFAIDRKIEYAVLIISALIALWAGGFNLII